MTSLKPARRLSTVIRMPGYLDLRGQLPETVACELPLYLAQPEINLVRVFLKNNVPYECTVRGYRWGLWQVPMLTLPYPHALQWWLQVMRRAETWPSLRLFDQCLTGPEWLRRAYTLTFYANGRLRLSFTNGWPADVRYVPGQWREITKDEVT